MPGMRTLLTVVLLTGAMGSMTGCLAVAAAGAAAGTVAYVSGALNAEFDEAPPRVHAAVEAACRDMGITISESKASELDAVVKGKTARDKNVSINIKATDTGGSEMSIRIGVFGDETLSRQLYDRIREKL